MRTLRAVFVAAIAVLVIAAHVAAVNDVRGYLDYPINNTTVNRYELGYTAGWAWDCYGGGIPASIDVTFYDPWTAGGPYVWVPDEGSVAVAAWGQYRPDAGAYLRGTGTCASATDYSGFTLAFGYGDNEGYAVPPAGTWIMVVNLSSSYGTIYFQKTLTITE